MQLSGAEGVNSEKQRFYSLETFLFAARDYLKISRAATDATGASLTFLSVERCEFVLI